MLLELATGQTMAFDRHGRSNATPLLLLHGLSSCRATYASVVDHLSDRVTRGEFQVLNIDLRGHGDSGRAITGGYDARSYATDIAELIDAVVGCPAIVVGHSLGGVVAATLAAEHPKQVSALLLEDPPFFEGDAQIRNASPVATFFPLMVAAVRELQRRGAPAEAYRSLVEDTTLSDVDERCDTLRRWDPETMQAAIDGTVWRHFNPVAALPCPVTILQADPAFGSVFKPHDGPPVLAANPQANIVPVPGAAHEIHGSQTLAAYLEQLDTFLRPL